MLPDWKNVRDARLIRFATWSNLRTDQTVIVNEAKNALTRVRDAPATSPWTRRGAEGERRAAQFDRGWERRAVGYSV